MKQGFGHVRNNAFGKLLGNAYFVQNELAGINVPDDVIKRYSPDMSKEEAQA